MRVLLLACCAVGLVRRDAETGGYFNSAIAEKVFVSGSAHCLIPFVYFNQRVQQPCSQRLTESLQEGRNAGLDEFPGRGRTLYERLAERPQLEELFQQAMGAYTRLAPQMTDLRELSEVRHLLDIGGGDATNAVRLCRRYPNLKVTLLDLPSVCCIARETVRRQALGARITCLEGDMFEDPWPAGADAVLLSHVVEIFSPPKVRALYQKAFDVLPAQGRLCVWAIMANDGETGSLQAAKSSIYFLSAASGEGMAYPGKEHAEWLRGVGFSHVARYDAPEFDHGALVAEK